MPIDIDGFAVLGAIAAKPSVFPAVKPDVAKTARALVGKQLKEKTLSLDGLKAIAQAIDLESFDLIADAMTDAEIKALLGKVDKLNDALKTAAPQAQRKHLADLARGAVAPAQKAAAPVKEAKPAKAPKPKVERSGNSLAMKAKKKA